MSDTPPDPHADRIIQAAMELAEADGYDAVRMRDVAAKADVALGTLYRRFSGKEELLAAALEKMMSHFHEAVSFAPVPGKTPEERLTVFLELATQALSERPKLASSLLRTVASGEDQLAKRIMGYRGRLEDILVMVYRGAVTEQEPTPDELLLSRIIQNTWFAEMIGWTGGMQTVDQALDHVYAVTRLALAGLENPR